MYKLENFGMEMPSRLEVEADSLAEVNAALGEESSKFGFQFVDVSHLSCSITKCVVANERVWYFWDHVHVTLPGSVRIAEATINLLARRDMER